MLNEDAGTADSGELTQVFGHLTVIRPSGEFIRGVKVYECRCDCGNLDKATIPLLMMGRKTSCGCQNRSGKEASKPKIHEVERLKALVQEDGRSLGEIAQEAGLTESLLCDGLESRRKLTLATTASLLKALGKHWSDLDEPGPPPASGDSGRAEETGMAVVSTRALARTLRPWRNRRPCRTGRRQGSWPRS